jgi:hypothetical protein
MCVRPHNIKKLHVPHVFLQGVKLSWVQNHKYLGEDRSNVTDMCSIYAKENLLIRNFRKRSPGVKEIVLRPISLILSCNQLWSNFSINVFKKLKTAFNEGAFSCPNKIYSL